MDVGIEMFFISHSPSKTPLRVNKMNERKGKCVLFFSVYSI